MLSNLYHKNLVHYTLSFVVSQTDLNGGGDDELQSHMNFSGEILKNIINPF